jgi:glycosyltransferase involved in cell wall biosynthesis
LHVHFALNATTIAMIIGRLSNISFSFTAHANDIFANPILLPEKIKAAKFIIAISQYNIDFLCRLVPSPEIRKKSHLVHCGIDVQHFAPVQKPDNNETPLILAVGRLVEKKGYPYLIKACNLLVQRGYRFRCLIIGGGPEQVTLQNMIDVHQLGDYVSLLGVVFQEDLKDRMAQADICVLPCVIAHDDDMDGIPNTLMEAMAMEIPVISTNISGIPELIDDHQSGLLVPAQDEQALAEAIATLFDQPELADRLGKAGREKVVAEFEIEKNARQVLSIFKQYLSNIRLPDRQVGPALVERRESLPSQDHL